MPRPRERDGTTCLHAAAPPVQLEYAKLVVGALSPSPPTAAPVACRRLRGGGGRCGDRHAAASHPYYREAAEVHARRARGIVDAELVVALRCILSRMAACNDEKSRFRCFLPEAGSCTKVSVMDEFTRLKSCFRCSNESLVLALVYIDRIAEAMPELAIGTSMLSGVFVASIMLAIKYLDDNFHNNEYYAVKSGIPLQQLNVLESLCLKLLGWQLFVQPEEYDVYRSLLLAVACHP